MGSDVGICYLHAHADTEMKRKAIALATGACNPTRNNPSTKLYTENDEELFVNSMV